jgi:hypothetical protein
MTARFPSAMVEECMALVPPTFLMAARDPTLDLPIDGSTDGSRATGRRVHRRPQTGLRRPSTLRDLDRERRVADAAERARLPVATVAPADVPHTQAVHITRVMLGQPSKHAQHNETYSGATHGRSSRWRGRRRRRPRAARATDRLDLSVLHQPARVRRRSGEAASSSRAADFLGLHLDVSVRDRAGDGRDPRLDERRDGRRDDDRRGARARRRDVLRAVPTFMDLRTGGYRQDWGPEDTLLKLAFTQLAHRYRVLVNVLTSTPARRRRTGRPACTPCRRWPWSPPAAPRRSPVPARSTAPPSTTTSTRSPTPSSGILCDVLEGVTVTEETLASTRSRSCGGADLTRHRRRGDT